MPTVTRAGSEVPVLGFGTYNMDSLECFRAVRRALSLGYRHLDTAMAYENESAVGRAIAAAPVEREEVFLTTKVKAYPEYLEYDAFLAEARDCLTRLGTDYIDLMLVHWWHPEGDMEGTMAAMDRLHEEGLVRNIGISNFSVDRMRRAMDYTDTPIFTNQIEYHAYRPRDELLAFCRANDVLLTAYSPLVQGRVLGDELLTEIGERYGKTEAQVAIRWLIQQDGVITIPKASGERHQRQNLDVFDFDLDPAEMRRIGDHEGPLWYRLNADGGLIQRARHRAGQHVPAWVRTAIP